MKKEPEKKEKTLEELLTERFPKLPDYKAQYAPRQLNIIEVEDKVVILKPIGVKEISQYSVTLVTPGLGMEVATRYLLDELWLAGDNEIRDDEEYFMAAMIQMQYIVETKKSRFTKL